MCFIKLLVISMCLNSSTPDTVFRIVVNSDTIYVTSTDVVRIDTSNFALRCHLTKEMSDILRLIKYDSCQVYVKNNDWILLQEYEMRAARIPEGYHITTDFGRIMYQNGVIYVGYSYPEKIKKKINYRKRYYTASIFQPANNKKESNRRLSKPCQ